MSDLREDEIRPRLIDIMWKYNKQHLLENFRPKYDLNNLSVKKLLDILEELLEHIDAELWECLKR